MKTEKFKTLQTHLMLETTIMSLDYTIRNFDLALSRLQ